MIDADEALRIGLVDAVLPRAELLAAGRARSPRRSPPTGPLAVAEAKRRDRTRGQSTPLDAAHRARAAQAFAALFATADQTEGMAAFLEKRAAARSRGK